MPAAWYDIVMEEGSQFNLSFTWKDKTGAAINLTGYSARMQVRESVEAASTLLSITSATEITLGGAAGTVVVVISAVVMAALDFKYGYYDLELLAAASEINAVRVIEGKVKFTKEVTR